jgi:hypothetical protein
MLDWLQDASVAVRRRREDGNPVALQPTRLPLPHLQRGARSTPCCCQMLLTHPADMSWAAGRGCLICSSSLGGMNSSVSRW